MGEVKSASASTCAEGIGEAEPVTAAPIVAPPVLPVAATAPDAAAAHAGEPEHVAGSAHKTPLQWLFALLRLESSDLWVIMVYAAALGVLSLATPIAVQALVNQVAFGQLLQPLVVLSLLLLSFLGLSGLLRTLQTVAAELLQQRLLVRVGATLAQSLPLVPVAVLMQKGPDLASRFLEIATVQKAAAGLLLDGLAVALQLVIGMTLLSFYHPLLLAFDLVLLGCVAIILFALGRGAVRTSIAESHAKYAVADWLAALCRHPLAFKFAGGPQIAAARADALLCDYVASRRRHFRIVLRQNIGALTLQALASAALLGIGGALVIAGQITLGQLIAAVLIVSSVLAGVAKLGKHLESYYDLLAALAKLGHLAELPTERSDGEALPDRTTPMVVALRGAAAGYPGSGPLLDGLNLQLRPGMRLAIIGPPQSGKSLLCELLTGLVPQRAGILEYDGYDLQDLQLKALRSQIALVCDEEPALFAGTVAEILSGPRASRTQAGSPSRQELRKALAAVGLWPAPRLFTAGLDTPLGDGAPSLSRDERWRLQVARVLVQRPRLVVLDKAIASGDRADDATAALLAPALPFTVVLCTAPGDPLLAHCDEVHVIGEGTLQALAPEVRP